MGERVPSPIVAAAGSSSTTAGKLAAQTWIRARLLHAPAAPRWHVEMSLDVRDAPTQLEFDEVIETRLRIEVFSEEWGVFFCHLGQASWIRVTDVAFVHGRDDFNLLPLVPPLKDLGTLLKTIERKHSLRFRREHAYVRTNVPRAEAAAKQWLKTL